MFKKRIRGIVFENVTATSCENTDKTKKSNLAGWTTLIYAVYDNCTDL